MKRSTEHIVDQMLVMRCQDGKLDALRKLVDRWQPRLWSHAARLTGNRDAAWDVVQEGWIGIIKGLGKLNDPAVFSRWAYRIVTNKAADWIRKHKQTRDRNSELDENSPAAPSHESEVTPDEADELLNRLPREQRTILSLYYLDDFSISGIAGILDIPKGTVKSRLFHAREQLKKSLSADYAD